MVVNNIVKSNCCQQQLILSITLISLLLLSCNIDGVYGVPTVRILSTLKSLSGGGSLITLVGDGFTQTPRLSFILDNTYEFQLVDTPSIDTWVFKAPPQPHSIAYKGDSKKRKADYSTTITSPLLYIRFPDGSSPVGYQPQPFEYIEPDFRQLTTREQVLRPNGMSSLRLIGNNFKVFNDDALPRIDFVRNIMGDTEYTQCPVILYEATRIDCRIPDGDAQGGVAIVITFANGQILEVSDTFYYRVPTVLAITPEPHHIASKEAVITINGEHFLGSSINTIVTLNPIEVINSQPIQCTSVNVIDSKSISCKVPIVNIPNGEYLKSEVNVVIGTTNAISGTVFTQYAPVITGFTPDSGLYIGGTRIRVVGRYLLKVKSANIAGVPCDIVAKDDDSFECITTSKFFPNNIYSDANPISAVIDDQQISSFNQFTFYMPLLTSISTYKAINKGFTIVVLKGLNLANIEKILFGNVEYQRNNIFNLQTEIRILFDPSRHLNQLGITMDVKVSQGSFTSNVLLNSFTIVEPRIIDYNIKEGFLKEETAIQLVVENFPPMLNLLDQPLHLSQVYQFTFATKPCIQLKLENLNDYTIFNCLVPQGDRIGDAIVAFNINNQDYTTNALFKYYEPKINRLTQSNTLPAGGGIMTLEGENLNYIDKLTIDKKVVDLSTCILTGTNKIDCVMAQKRPGFYDVSVFRKNNEYKSPTQLHYQGPIIETIKPARFPKWKDAIITLTGKYFGADQDCTVDIGGVPCVVQSVNVTFTELVCRRNANGIIGVYDVILSVRYDPNNAPVASTDEIKFATQPLSCLGPPDENYSNHEVPWWFAYKIAQSNVYNNYLYADSTNTTLRKYSKFANVAARPYSPIAATFSQYFDPPYHHIIYTDQTGSRDSDGLRMDRHISGRKQGHLKGIVLWEETDPVTGLVNGIHISHSNPVFPTERDGNTFYRPLRKLKFMGLPDYSQHFFCYSFTNLNDIGRFLLYSDAQITHKSVPDMSLWAANKITAHAQLYDLLRASSANPVWPQRAGGRSQNQLMETCSNSVLGNNNANLLNRCFWTFDSEINGMTTRYYMKQSINPRLVFPTYAANPPNLNRFTVRSMFGVSKYEGLDIYQFMAADLGRKYFSYFFYKPFQPTPALEEVINVGHIHLHPYLSDMTIVNNVVTGYQNYEFSGKSNDHSKLAFPIYPAYDDNKYDDNENMFCVGGSNRHNGQPKRGAGLICFQCPDLVYQFNRMVRSYTSKFDATGANQLIGDAIMFAEWITQPISLDNWPNPAWPNDLLLEIKDNPVVNVYHQQIPRLTPLYGSTNASIKVITSAIRTRIHATYTGMEQSVLNNPPTLPNQPDISTFVYADKLSVHYIAFDVRVAAFCAWKATEDKCDKDNARASVINVIGAPNVNYPRIRNIKYNAVQSQRTYNLLINEDFKKMQFIRDVRTALGIPEYFPPYEIRYNPDIIGDSYFQPPKLIERKIDTLCHEELTYLILLNYIYTISATDPSEVVFKVGNNQPNWANGIILAISKHIYNSIDPTKNGAFDQCMALDLEMSNIDTYKENDPVLVPTLDNELLFKRTAAATWDLLKTNYRDGKAGPRVNKPVTEKSIPWEHLLIGLLDLRPNNNINSLKEFIDGKLDPMAYGTELNYQILINNYLEKKPEPPPPVVVNNNNNNKQLLQFKKSLMAMGFIQETNPLDDGAELIETYHEPILSLFSTSLKLSFDFELMMQMDDIKLLEINDALKKWITIDNVNQAISVLLLEKSSNLELQFIEDLNKDSSGVIDLCYNDTNGDLVQEQITLCKPQSIVTITNFLENIIKTHSGVQQHVNRLGDLEFYYLPNPIEYNGGGDNNTDGMVIATLNSKICDMKMTNLLDFQNLNSPLYLSICSKSGPIITSSIPLNGNTDLFDGQSINWITISGYRFTEEMNVYVGEKQASINSFNPTQIIAQYPNNIGINHLIKLTSPTHPNGYGLQSTKFRFSYLHPSIDGVIPNPLGIDSNGGQILTISGLNFGQDKSSTKVYVDNGQDECIIASMGDTKIYCYSPQGIGKFKSITVVVGDQSSLLRINSPTFNYQDAVVDMVIPDSADPNDFVAIHGSGFGDPDDNYPPIVYIGGEMVEIENYTSNDIWVRVPQSVGSIAPISIQQISGGSDDSFTTLYDFSYLQPFISGIVGGPLNTTGGWIIFKGYGWGLSEFDIDFIKVGNVPLDRCKPFSTFMECLIPPGVGGNLAITGSISSQLIDDNFITFSYKPPLITNVFIPSAGVLRLVGTNFIPSSAYVVNSTDTYVLVYYVGNQTPTKCSNLAPTNSTQLVCNVNTVNIQSVVAFIGGQQSNSWIFMNVTGTLFYDRNYDNVYENPGGDYPWYNLYGATVAVVDVVNQVSYQCILTGDGKYYIYGIPSPTTLWMFIQFNNNQPEPEFAPLNSNRFNVSTSIKRDIAVMRRSNICSGYLSSVNDNMEFIEGKYNLTNYGYCDSTVSCSHPVLSVTLTQTTCQYRLVNNILTVAKVTPVTFTLRYYVDPNMTAINTGIYVTNKPTEFSILLSYTDVFGFATQSKNVDNSGFVSFTVFSGYNYKFQFITSNPLLFTVFNNITLPVNGNLVMDYPLFYDMQPVGNQYPVAQFYSETSYGGITLTFPVGKFQLSKYGWSNRIKSYSASASKLNVLFYSTTSDSSLRTDIPVNGLVPSINPLLPSLEVVEITSTVLFSFNSPSNPLRPPKPPFIGLPRITFDRIYHQVPTTYWTYNPNLQQLQCSDDSATRVGCYVTLSGLQNTFIMHIMTNSLNINYNYTIYYSTLPY